jgi:hypothetical protein
MPGPLRLEPTARPPLRPPRRRAGFVPGAVTEIHPQAEAFVRTLAERLQRGVAFFIDYGFPEHEYYHPQRHGGTLMCHRAHRADTDPLADVGCKDITAHVDFSAIALAAQDAGLQVLGYTSQARFLLNCGLPQLLAAADAAAQADARRSCWPSTRWASCSRCSAWPRAPGFDAIGFRARRPLAHRCEPSPGMRMRWLIVFLLAFLVFNGLRAWLRRHRAGAAAGRLQRSLFGREVYLPVASSLVLSLLAMAVGLLF